MGDFIKGLELCEQFFIEIAQTIFEQEFPGLAYSAGLIGYGSDVLGYDDETSTDHMWGPRFYLFLSERDIQLKTDILDAISTHFPYTYKGYSVNFSEPDPNDNGVRHPVFISEGRCSPLVFIHTFEEYIRSYLGVSALDTLDERDWLAFSEHRLLALTSGKLYVDRLDLRAKLNRLSYYPEPVRLYLIASNWSLIAEEQAFMRRCFDVGDTVGSALVCGRIAERLMRLAFLYCGRYAPYSKWFGTAFSRLPVDKSIKAAISAALLAADIDEREDKLVTAQKLLADLHNASGITDYVDVKIEAYYGRKIKVIFADKIVAAVIQKLAGTVFEDYPLIGTLSAVANFTTISDEPDRREAIKGLYRK
jgi:hypothetical protein